MDIHSLSWWVISLEEKFLFATNFCNSKLSFVSKMLFAIVFDCKQDFKILYAKIDCNFFF
jgi:hypothetical protein